MKLSQEELKQLQQEEIQSQVQAQYGATENGGGLTTAEDFRSRQPAPEDFFVRLTCGLFKIQPISIAQAYMLTGSMLLNRLRDAVIGEKKPEEAATKILAKMPDAELIKYAKDNAKLAEFVICAGVESLNFCRKRPEKCEGDEVSVYGIPPDERQLLAMRIIEISAPIDATDSVASFRDESED